MRSLRPRTGGRPVLVTGVPRSGTTWVARQLALAPGTSLAGREPMNPRGSQYGLAATLTGWTELVMPTRRQRFALRTAYAGINPMVYSRFGSRQWGAPLPWRRLIVKDPFALLSLPVIHDLTGAETVVVVRHPGAVLASYRRMGWAPDLAEVDAIARGRRNSTRSLSPSGNAATDMGLFWSALHSMAIPGIDATGAKIVFHDDLAAGGVEAARRLFHAVRLAMTAQVELRWSPETRSPPDEGRLHNFDRDPETVATGWRRAVDRAEMATLEELTRETMSALRDRRLSLGVSST